MKPSKAVIIFHGYGDCGRGISGLAQFMTPLLPPNTELMCPDAPLELLGVPDGRAWFDLSDYDPMSMSDQAARREYCSRLPSRVKQQVLDAALPMVNGMMRQFSLIQRDMAFVGFSQGAFVATMVALELSNLAALICLSGIPVEDERITQGRLPKMLVVHGTADEVLPFSMYEDWRDYLRIAGASVEFLEVKGMGHEVNEQVVRRASGFITQNFSNTELDVDTEYRSQVETFHPNKPY
jgi:phospholipase/carboxylesterase